MSDRWVLNRAGIVNVYQYGQETLNFAGGRLLLRGVNGSGKSTAMNMLLPFLLDGDARHIDAAGEQAGVLKSWMLSGREDTQPVGYLWLELARGAEYLTFGCGIKANRTSDTVSTWWWVTSRRPGVDLDLVEGQHPLSMEALRATLGADPVFRQEQRNLYRAEVRDRLYGGADIAQHIRLLHIVRNPRVGDRIDVDLPNHLHDALPQLSETALLDAAQPLDDLEEHRRNVEELTKTASTLDALGAVYTSYARAELHRRAGQARDLVAEAERARRDSAAAHTAAREAERILRAAKAQVEQLAGDETRIRTELTGLKDSPAYADAGRLVELRARVDDLRKAVVTDAEHLNARTAAQAKAAKAVEAGARTAYGDWDNLATLLRDLAGDVVDAGLPIGAPDLAPLSVTTLEAESGLPQPAEPFAEVGIRSRLEELRSAVLHRRGDLDEVRQELEAVNARERALRVAADNLETARDQAELKQANFIARRQQLDQAVTAWRAGLAAWIERLDGHRGAHQLGPWAPPDLGADLVGRRREVEEALTGAAEDVVAHHLGVIAGLDARRSREQSDFDELASEVAQLDAIVVPSPPTQPWQRPERGPVLAELIDFRPDVGEVERAGIEAAMEAAGLLGAEMTPEGVLDLAEGGLVVRPGPATANPLSRLLTVEENPGTDIEAGAIVRLLETISIDPGHLDGPGVNTVVTVDGRFRIGVLHGHHQKTTAEHIGLTARRATLERQRVEARRRLELALATLDVTDRELAAAKARLTDARALRSGIPSGQAVDQASLAVEVAERDVAMAEQLVEQRRGQHNLADDAHAEAVDKSQRVAANLGLPTDANGLGLVERALNGVWEMTHRAGATLIGLTRAVEQWILAAEGWREATIAVGGALAHLASAQTEHDLLAARLATIEDSMDVPYDEIMAAVDACEDELKRTSAGLEIARQIHTERHSDLAKAETRIDEMDRVADNESRRCVAMLPRLRRAFDVAGLLAAATDDEPVLRESVEESPAGVRALADAIEAHVPPPARADVTAESVRQSLRQRRDALGAGWDAEDRQVDETLPLAIEINGPQGRLPLAGAIAVVATRVRELTALLSREQDGALRNLLQGLVAHEVAEKFHAAGDLIDRMNRRLDAISTAHGIGVSLRWRRRDGLDPEVVTMVGLLSKPPDLRTTEQDQELRVALSSRLDQARRDDPDAPYRDLIGRVLDYRSWHEIVLLLRRPGRTDERLSRRTALSEGEKKIVSYLPLFAAVAASCDSLAEMAADAPRFVLLDDAFAKVSEDNHPKLFGFLVELDLDFIATSERLWGTHATVPELAITEVIRDAALGVIVLEHSRWNGTARIEDN